MATYYVQPSGSNSNTGLNASPSGAWQTISKALGATGITSGDTVYIAPGTYRESVQVLGTYGSRVSIIGDPTSSQFSGITPAPVRLTAYTSDALNSSSVNGGGIALSLASKSNMYFNKLWIEGTTYVSGGSGVTFYQCQMTSTNQPTPNTNNAIVLTLDMVANQNLKFMRCYMQGGHQLGGTAATNTGVRYNACILQLSSIGSQGGFEYLSTGLNAVYWTNCTITGASQQQIWRAYQGGLGVTSGYVYNCLIIPDYCSPTMGGATSGFLVEDYNAGYISRANVNAGANTKQLYHRSFYQGQPAIMPVQNSQLFLNPLIADSLTGAGSASYTTDVDFFGNAWANPPSIGAMEYASISSIGSYLPYVTTNSNINFVAGSTSKSVNLYLGAIGLSSNTSSLQLFYTRQNSSAIQITMAYQTPTGAWTSGGFCEIDSSNNPGLYRLDLPNAAIASGASLVNIIAKGANNFISTNMTINLQATQLDLTQSIPTSNTPNTVGDALNAARAQGFGKWVITGTSLNLYAPDGTTIIRSFTLNSATEPTSRI